MREHAYEKVSHLIQELIVQAGSEADVHELVAGMKRLVPEFNSTSSDFATLDGPTISPPFKKMQL